MEASDYLMLENLTYIDRKFKDRTGISIDWSHYDSLGQLLDSVFDEEELAKFDNGFTYVDKNGETKYYGVIDGGENSSQEWAAMIRYMKSNEEIRNLRVVDAPINSNGKTFALRFEDIYTEKTVVAFRGTLDGEEWRDNVEGMLESDTLAQKEALDYIESIPGGDIVVVGHSKGGNKAQYVGILSEKVSKAYSFDGQGFSKEFIDKYHNEIWNNHHKINYYALDTDFVHGLLYQLPYIDPVYVSGGSDVTSGFQNHSPDAFFCFTKDSEGRNQIVLDNMGKAYFPITNSEVPAIAWLHCFTVFVLNVVPENEKKRLSSYLSEVVYRYFSGEYSSKQILQAVFSDSDSLAMLLAIISKFMDVYDLNSYDLDALTRIFGVDSPLSRFLTTFVEEFLRLVNGEGLEGKGFQVLVKAFKVADLFLPGNVNIVKKVIKELAKHYTGINVDVAVEAIEKVPQKYKELDVVDKDAAKEDYVCQEGSYTKDFSEAMFNYMIEINHTIRNRDYADSSSWARFSGYEFYPSVYSRLAKNKIDLFAETMTSICQMCSEKTEALFDETGDAYRKMCDEINATEEHIVKTKRNLNKRGGKGREH